MKERNTGNNSNLDLLNYLSHQKKSEGKARPKTSQLPGSIEKKNKGSNVSISTVHSNIRPTTGTVAGIKFGSN